MRDTLLLKISPFLKIIQKITEMSRSAIVCKEWLCITVAQQTNKNERGSSKEFSWDTQSQQTLFCQNAQNRKEAKMHKKRKRHLKCPAGSSYTTSKKWQPISWSFKKEFKISPQFCVCVCSWSVTQPSFAAAGESRNRHRHCRASLTQTPNSCWCCQCRDM